MRWPDHHLNRDEHAHANLTRNLRYGPNIFYLGPNGILAKGLSERGDDLAMAICYFWSVEMLNAAPFHNFSLGVIAAREWPNLLAKANRKVQALLAHIPVGLFTCDDEQAPVSVANAPTPFPFYYVQRLHLSGTGEDLHGLSDMIAHLSRYESPPWDGEAAKVIPLERNGLPTHVE